MNKKLAIIGEFSPDFEPHRATNAAIEHSKEKFGLNLEAVWISTEAITTDFFDKIHGLWVAPGSPYKSMEKTLWAIQHARENKIPCFGTCGGFQHMMIEYARNVLGFKDAQHAEYDPYASKLFISRLACSLVGREMELNLVPGSMVASIYGKKTIRERYYCNFGVNPEYVSYIKKGPLQIVGSDSEGELRIIELPGHPFFVGTLFVPQTLSTKENPHPIVTSFLKALREYDL
jgi:CTP synthase (UTP-ammonia lyase)